MAQSPATRTYQSFSYEPGVAAPAPIATGRPMVVQPSPRGGRFDAPYLRADSKASGSYLWNAR
jgi:hypothetical protein